MIQYTGFYICQGILFVFLFLSEDGKPSRIYEVGQPIFFAVAGLVFAAAFTVVGYRLHKQTKKMWKCKIRQMRMNRIRLVSICCTSAFVIRSAVNFLWQWIDAFDSCNRSLFEFFFYALIEIIPLATMVLVMSSTPKKNGGNSGIKQSLLPGGIADAIAALEKKIESTQVLAQ